MKHCPECKSPNVSTQDQFCPNCGCDLSQTPSQGAGAGADDELEFVITEAHTQGPEFVGGKSTFVASDDGLPVRSTSDLVQDEATARTDDSSSPMGGVAPSEDSGPIGRYDAPIPTSINDEPDQGVAPDIGAEDPRPTHGMSFNPPDQAAETASDETADPPDDGQYLSDREKEEIIRKIGAGQAAAPNPDKAAADPTTPAMPDSPDLQTPVLSQRGRGVAFFYRNYIQISGSQVLHADDELLVNDRCYRLKPKKVKPGIIVGAGAALFAALLIIIGSLLVTGSDTGNGEIIGMALDDLGRPYVQGAVIRLPELGLAVESSPQGFFRSGQSPSGTHKLEYRVGGELVGEDYATVASGRVSVVSLSPTPLEADSPASAQTPASPQAVAIAQTEPTPKATPQKKPTGSNSSTPSQTKSTSKYAKLTLAANVEGAKLSLDGSILGAGNITYARVKPGTHKYLVEADGYQPMSGVIELKVGDDHKLVAELNPMATAQKEVTYSAEDFYYSAVANVKAGESASALADFTKAVEKQPSYAEAYLGRADVHSALKNRNDALDDYIRAAEIFRINKDFNRAITAYNSAIEVNKTSLTAYLGRGDLYLAKGQEIAAIADYDQANKIDKNSAAAQFGLGKARYQLGNYKKAIKHFNEARKLDEKNATVYQYLMLSYLARDDVKEVKKNFERFTELASESEIQRMAADAKYSAVLRVVDEN